MEDKPNQQNERAVRSTDPGLTATARRYLYALERMTPWKRRLTEAGFLPPPPKDGPLPPGFEESV